MKTKRLPLRYWVPSALALLALGLTAFTFGYDWLRSDRVVEDLTVRRALALGSVVSPTVERLLGRNEVRVAEAEVARLVVIPNLNRALVLDETNRIQHATDFALLGQSLNETPAAEAGPLLARARETKSAQTEITRDGVTLRAAFPFPLRPLPGELHPSRMAVLYTETDLGTLKRAERAAIAWRSLVIGVAAFLACFAAWAYFHRAFTRRLDELVGGVAAYSGDQKRLQVPVEGEDELARVGRAVNQLVSDLAVRTSAMRENEALLRTLTNHASVGMVMVTADHRYVYANDAYAEAFGLPTESIVGRRVSDVLAPVYEGQIRPRLDRAFSGERVAYELTLPSGKAGESSRFFAVTYDPSVETIHGPCVIVVVVDITGRKRAEAQLRESEASLMEAQRIANLGSYVFDFDTDTWTSSAQLDEQLGIDDTYERSMAGWLELVHPDDRTMMADAFKEALAKHQHFEKEYRVIRHSDGTERWLWSRASVERDADGNPRRVRGTSLDITERKAAEQRIQHLNRVYAVLSDINQTIVREKNQQAMLEAACRIAVEKGNFRMAWIGMLDAETKKVKPVASAGAVDGYLDQMDIDVQDETRNTGPTARALLSGTHVICADLRTDPQFGPWRDEALRRGYRSSAAFPLGCEGKIVGTFNLYWHEPGFFNAEELRLLDELAMDIGFALDIGVREAAQHSAEERHARQRDALIMLTGQHPPVADDATGALRQITESAARTLGVARASIWLYNTEHSAIRCLDLFESGPTRHSGGTVLSATTHPAYFRSLAEVEVIAADDAITDRRTCEFADDYLRPLDIRAMLDVPIHIGGKLEGVLCHEHIGSSRQWTEDEKNFAVAMANLVSLALEGMERQRAETALRANEERFRELAETIQEVFWITDPAKKQMLYISPAYEKVWGRTCASLYAAPRTWLDAIHTDDRARVLQAAETKQTRGDYDETYRILRPDGAVRWIHDRAFPVRDTAGKIVRVVGTAEDITQQRQTEEQLRQAQKMEGIGQLAGGVAHDFNNILAAMMMQAELTCTLANLPDEAREGVQQVRVYAERAANLTRQLLLFSRRQVMQPRDLDLNEAVTGLVKMLRRIIGEDVQLQLHLGSERLITHADAGMLDQVLMNLTVNARDAMPDGGRLLIETAERIVDENQARLYTDATPGRYVWLSISDTGTGIPPEVLPHIFEPFFTTKDVGKGTGLGLATVFGIVRQHRGWIKVYSEQGQGTNFQIFLPACEIIPEASVRAKSQAKPRGGTETILVVEDETNVRTLTRIVLERAGYRVLEAANGVEALQIWEHEGGGVHMLFTDLVMPEGVSGRELAAELQGRKPGLKVIFTSGYSAEIAGRQLTLREGQNFLQKPCSPAKALETVRRCLDGE